MLSFEKSQFRISWPYSKSLVRIETLFLVMWLNWETYVADTKFASEKQECVLIDSISLRPGSKASATMFLSVARPLDRIAFYSIINSTTRNEEISREMLPL